MSLRGMGTGAQPWLGDRLGRLTLPALCIAGADDDKFRALAEVLAAGLPNARCEVMPGAGHSVHLDTPDAYTTTVNDFLLTSARRRPAPPTAARTPAPTARTRP